MTIFLTSTSKCCQKGIVSPTKSAKTQMTTELLISSFSLNTIYGLLRIWWCWVNNQAQFNALLKTLTKRRWRPTSSTSGPPQTSKAPMCKRGKPAEVGFTLTQISFHAWPKYQLVLVSLLKSEKNLENSSRNHELTHLCLHSTTNDFRRDILNAHTVVTNSSCTSTETSSYSTYLEIPGSLPQLPKCQKTQLSPVQPSTGNIYFHDRFL